MTSPLVEDSIADDYLAVAHLDPAGADDGGDAPAAGDDRGVACEAAAGREDAGGSGHPVDVVG